ncbi:MAG: gluconeogenesis factor YvcK family protein [Bryobacteraceae bacterium]
MTHNTSLPDAKAADNLRIVAIGGGSGLSSLLHGLKKYVRPSPADTPALDIAAVVTVTDDGGSSGRLRREFEVLPPGDIRNCMVALSEDEGLLSRLFQYRFEAGRGLKGHSFGNLFLTALTDITGDFQQAVKLSSEVLAIAGRIYPSTSANVALEAVLEDGRSVVGETKISRSKCRIERIRLRPPRCRPLAETLAAIADADLITLGPGSLFTSVIPNLLVQGIPQAIRRSPAIKAYFVNLMWQPGETMRFRASDHVRAIHNHARGGDLLDYVVVNTRGLRPSLARRYASAEARPVENDLDGLAEMGLHVVARDLLLESARVRHDPEAIAAVAIELAIEGRLRRRKTA